MAKFKVKKTKDYTIMSNYHLKEKNMSLKAKGLLSVMLSLPDNWDYSIAGLVAISQENETAIKSALSELKQFGYLEVIKLMPNESETGRIDYIYNVYEKPKQEVEKQGVENLGVENLEVEILEVENQGQLNTNNKILNNKYNNINIINTKRQNIDNNIKENIKEIEVSHSAKAEQCDIPYEDIINYLNFKTGTNFRSNTNKTRNLIKARFNEGFTAKEFKIVIDKKCIEWLNNKDMNKYLRPETLFGTKFEGYLNQKITITTKELAPMMNFDKFR